MDLADGRGWCWKKRSMRQGYCRSNFMIQALCLRTCGLCPAVEPKVLVDEITQSVLALRLAANPVLQAPARPSPFWRWLAARLAAASRWASGDVGHVERTVRRVTAVVEQLRLRSPHRVTGGV